MIAGYFLYNLSKVNAAFFLTNDFEVGDMSSL